MTNFQFYKTLISGYKHKIAQMFNERLDDLIEKTEKASPNEKIAVREIFKAAAEQDSRGRLYSGKWIILSLILYMRSPATSSLILKVQTIRR